MRTLSLIVFALCLSSVTLLAQTTPRSISTPVAKDFTGTLFFLSSNWMEGREAGTRGSFMAADYIASMMQSYGLFPYGDSESSYFQNFDVIRYKTENASFAFISRSVNSESSFQLSSGIDFELTPVPASVEAEADIVFAGYGIAAPNKGYDDYAGLDVKGRIVVVLDGFPGHADTNSLAWKKLGRDLGEEQSSMGAKLQMAENHGAVAMIIVVSDGSIKPYSRSQCNIDILQSAMNSPKKSGRDYEDYEYALPGDTTIAKIPCFSLGLGATNQLFAGTGIVLADFEAKTARNLTPASINLRNKMIRFSVAVKSESVAMRNVLGILRGKDTTKSVIVGAHYDHRGIRNGNIYNGADDNASGTSGMLALGKAWSEFGEQPACNIIFAAWTAEEKGILGSSYFVQHAKSNPNRILLSINLDMISRSAPEDTARRQLSIGTKTDSVRLKQIARKINLRLTHPFELELWDVTGHTGSDYAPFTAREIPVMTFFSGFHNDYHSPRDVAAKIDPEKMEEILKIVDGCIREFFEFHSLP